MTRHCREWTDIIAEEKAVGDGPWQRTWSGFAHHQGYWEYQGACCGHGSGSGRIPVWITVDVEDDPKIILNSHASRSPASVECSYYNGQVVQQGIRDPSWSVYGVDSIPSPPEKAEEAQIDGSINTDLSKSTKYNIDYSLIATFGGIQTITAWINAFIPHDISTVTRTVPGTGPHAGKSMIPSTFWGDCFLTDQRSYSFDPQAKSRMHSKITIDIVEKTMEEHHRCDETVEVDCEDGDEEGQKQASTNRMQYSNFRVSNNSQEFAVNLKGAASNPLVLPSRLIGDIDYEGVLTITTGEGRESADIQFEGKVDVFPAFEMYVQADNQPPERLFKKPPQRTKTAMNLGGSATRAVTTSKTVRAN